MIIFGKGGKDRRSIWGHTELLEEHRPESSVLSCGSKQRRSAVGAQAQGKGLGRGCCCAGAGSAGGPLAASAAAVSRCAGRSDVRRAVSSRAAVHKKGCRRPPIDARWKASVRDGACMGWTCTASSHAGCHAPVRPCRLGVRWRSRGCGPLQHILRQRVPFAGSALMLWAE